MKSSFLIFFSIVLSVYGLISYYIFRHGYNALSGNPTLRIYYVGLFIFLTLSYVGGRILESYWRSIISEGLHYIGSFWLGAFVYFLFFVIIVDFIRLANKIFPFLNKLPIEYDVLKFSVFIFSIVTVAIIVFAGYINARNPVVNTLEINLPKKSSKMRELNVVMMSDIHLGTLIGKSRFEEIVTRVNALNPDIILLAGDIVDEDITPVIEDNTGEALMKLKAIYGVYGITGNHEYIGGVEPAVTYLTQHGIRMLRDESVLIDSGFYLIGREDKDSKRFSNKDRKPLNDLMYGVDKNYPIIVLNHQPVNLAEAVESNVDLHLSGHTHHGQLFPFNYLTEKIYEISRGYKLIGNTQFFVSNGVGTWGPPMRLGSKPEIVNIKIKFE